MSNSTPGTSRQSPPKKRPRQTRAQVTTREKEIAVNVYKYVEKTHQAYPRKTEIYETTAEIMCMSVKTVRNIVKGYNETGVVPQAKERQARKSIIGQLDDCTLTAIRRKVQQFFINGDLPSVTKVTAAINNDKNLPNFSETTTYKILKKINFKYEKRSGKRVLIDTRESPDLQIVKQEK